MKKVPMRMCLGCREMKPKAQLVRVVCSPQGEVSLDIAGRKPGRGAYVCGAPACMARIRKIKALERALKAPVPPEVFEELGNEAMRRGAAAPT